MSKETMGAALEGECNKEGEGLTLETPAFKTPYGGQFTLSTQLIILNYPRVLY